MSTITTEYDIDENSRVTPVTFQNDQGDTCTATVSEADPDLYVFKSKLDDDVTDVEAPKLMSLADCILAANVHLGIIPPENFDPITCPNQH